MSVYLYMICRSVCIHVDLIYTYTCITAFIKGPSRLLREHLESFPCNIVIKHIVHHIFNREPRVQF